MDNPLTDVIPNLDDLAAFIRERHAIKLRREAGHPWPWSAEPILQNYYFCNMHRENDKVTRWLASNWRQPHAADPDVWFALAIFRRGFNNPSVGEELGYPVPWNPDRYLEVYARRQREGIPFLRPAYMTPGPAGKSGGNVAELQVRYIFNPLWANRSFVRPCPGESLADFYERLNEQYCCGGFYAGQVVADLKYVQLKDAPDWDSFVVPGPGSRRGLNRVFSHLDANERWNDRDWHRKFQVVRKAVVPLLAPLALHAQDLQNAMCEYDKFCRVRLGEGKVRPYRKHGVDI